MHRKLVSALLAGLIAGFALAPSAQATGDVWVEGSYEFLNLPNVQFINNYFFAAGLDGVSREEFVNDDGDFDGFRIDGGISNIPIMGGAYMIGLKGFFAWHDDGSELQCTVPAAVSGSACLANPLVDNTAIIQAVSAAPGTNQFTTNRDVDHWGVAIEVAQGPMGLKVGPAFRRIDQDITITGRKINSFPAAPDPFQLTYSEDLETNYWGAFVGADGSIDLGSGWALVADGEAGLYWADTDYSGSYVVTNALTAVAPPVNPNVSQSLTLESDELAFIGVLKAALEKDFGMFKLAGFGRVEYISSAPDVGYNDLDVVAGVFTVVQGSEDETRIGERYAVAASVGARLIVPMGSAQ